MRLGLYRTTDPLLGEAARVHESAGDAAPFVSRYLYELLDFRPAFESLPEVEECEGLLPPDMEASLSAAVPSPHYA